MLKAVEYLDCATKFEILLTSFHATMRACCYLEIFVTVILGGFFIRSPSKMWFQVFHLGHIGRGVVGLLTCQKVPYPQDFIKTMKKAADAGLRMTFEEYAKHVELQVIKATSLMFEEIKQYLLAYFVLTLMCMLGDGIDMIIQFSRFAGAGNDYTEIVLVLGISSLMVCNFIWFGWVIHAKLRMPVASESMSKAMLGLSSTFQEEVIAFARAARDDAKSLAQKRETAEQ